MFLVLDAIVLVGLLPSIYVAATRTLALAACELHPSHQRKPPNPRMQPTSASELGSAQGAPSVAAQWNVGS